MKNKTKYTHRFVARFVLEAVTPLAIGSGEKDLLTDALVVRDVNGLPYIPGSSLAGVLRHASNDENGENPLFGWQTRNKGGHGSQFIISDAKMIGAEGRVIDGLQIGGIDFENEFYRHYATLPIRQHVRIDHQGVAADGGKFDEQVVIAGTRFAFEIELVADNDPIPNATFDGILNEVYTKIFRVGSGTRNGFGQFEVISCHKRVFDLNNSTDLEAYLSHSSCLSDDVNGFEEFQYNPKENTSFKSFMSYELKLKADDFFLMGSGFGDKDVDMTAVKARKVSWADANRPLVVEELALIPATSLKGALAHRVAYHYNKLTGVFADTIETTKDFDAHTGSNNKAVRALFGIAGNGKDAEIERGHVLFSDIIGKEPHEHIFNHVSIDRFTGGAYEGALFSDKPTMTDEEFSTTIWVERKAIEDEKVKKAWEQALLDLANGMLLLGGGVNRGLGVFTGAITCNGESLTNEQ